MKKQEEKLVESGEAPMATEEVILETPADEPPGEQKISENQPENSDAPEKAAEAKASTSNMDSSASASR